MKQALPSVVVIGDERVGKSSFCSRLVNDSFAPTYTRTVAVDFVLYKKQDLRLVIYDTSGEERFRALISRHVEMGKGIILMFDVSNRKSFEHLNMWMDFVQTRNGTDPIKIIIGNKVDCDESQRQVSEEEAKEFAASVGLKYFESSAKSGLNVSESIEELARNIMMKDDTNIVKKTDDRKESRSSWSSWFKDKLGLNSTPAPVASSAAATTTIDSAESAGEIDRKSNTNNDSTKANEDVQRTAAELESLVTKFSTTLGAMSTEYEKMQALRRQLESDSLSAAGLAAVQAEMRNIESKYKSSPEDQTERDYIAANPALKLHYEQMQKIFNEAFLVAAALSGGMIAVEKTSASGVFGALIQLSQGIPIVPGVLSFVSVGVDCLLEVRQEGRYSFLAALNPTSNPTEAGRWSERVARYITVTAEVLIVSIHEEEKQSELSTIKRFLAVLEDHARRVDKGLAQGLFSTESAVELLTIKHAKAALDHILSGNLDGMSDDDEAVAALVEAVVGWKLKRLAAAAVSVAASTPAPAATPAFTTTAPAFSVSVADPPLPSLSPPPPPPPLRSSRVMDKASEGSSSSSNCSECNESGASNNTRAIGCVSISTDINMTDSTTGSVNTDMGDDGLDDDTSLSNWLKNALGKLAPVHLEQCVAAFKDSGIETESELMHLSVSDLTQAELQSMGIGVIGVRNKILIQFEKDKSTAVISFVASSVSVDPEDVASASLVESLQCKLSSLEAQVTKLRNGSSNSNSTAAGGGGGQMFASAEDQVTESGQTVKETVEELKRELLSLQQHVHVSQEGALAILLSEVQRMQHE